MGVATAIGTGGPGALFWMEVAAFFGMATKYAEGLLAVKYRRITPRGTVLGGPFYYIETRSSCPRRLCRSSLSRHGFMPCVFLPSTPTGFSP